MNEKKSYLMPLIALAVVIVAAGFVWKFFSIEQVEIVTVPEVKEECPVPAPNVEVKQTDEVGTQIVLMNGDGIGQITVTDPTAESEAHILLKTPCNSWIVASTTGRGGYIFYGGFDQLYQLDYSEKSLARVDFDGFMTDLASDETRVASVSALDGPLSVIVTSTTTKERTVYKVPSPYNDAGTAKFSPDGTKIAYAAIERDENGDPVKRAIFIIDLTTGEQTLSGREDLAPGFAPYVTGWANNTTPIVSDRP